MLGALAPSGLMICPQKLEQMIRRETALEIIKESAQHPSAVLMGIAKPMIPAAAAQPDQIVLVGVTCIRVLVAIADCFLGTKWSNVFILE